MSNEIYCSNNYIIKFNQLTVHYQLYLDREVRVSNCTVHQILPSYGKHCLFVAWNCLI